MSFVPNLLVYRTWLEMISQLKSLFQTPPSLTTLSSSSSYSSSYFLRYLGEKCFILLDISPSLTLSCFSLTLSCHLLSHPSSANLCSWPSIIMTFLQKSPTLSLFSIKLAVRNPRNIISQCLVLYLLSIHTFSLDHLTRLSNSTSSVFYKTNLISVLDMAMLISQGHLKYNTFRMHPFIFSSKSLLHSVLPIYIICMSIHTVCLF